MNIKQFLAHYNITENPFSDEDATTDPVFKSFGIDHAYHPAWDKIYGNPSEPATSVVFGEKGSGKTALRLQMTRRLSEYNAQNPSEQTYVVVYDDFNPFLDRFREKMPFWAKKTDKVLRHWKIWDHLDAILALAVTQLLDRILKVESVRHPAVPPSESLPLDKLSHPQIRDLLLLAAYYDCGVGENRLDRWEKIRRLFKYQNWKTWNYTALGAFLSLTGGIISLISGHTEWMLSKWFYLFLGCAWTPVILRFLWAFFLTRKILAGLRILEHEPSQLRKMILRFPGKDLANQPVPFRDKSDDRYSLLTKFQSIIRSLGFPHMLVLVDRVDEPYIVNGNPMRMKELVWPMLDNKLLKHPDIGFKLLLPGILEEMTVRETDEFRERARLDKQNTIRSFNWTGQALYDLANIRLRGCTSPNEIQAISLENLFESSINRDYLVSSLHRLEVPRRLFKFLYQLILTHTSMYSDTEPNWKISQATFLTTLNSFNNK